MRYLKTALVLSILLFNISEVFAGWPYSMTYSPSSGDTIESDHITVSNTEHINNNIPESIDDYSTNAAEMRSTRDPYPSAAVSLATTLDDELEGLRYVIAQITGETYWYIDPPTFCENSADYDHGTGDFTTGGKLVLDVAGSGISTDGSINFGTNTASLWSDGTDLFGSSTADISLNATGNDHIFQSAGVTQATIDDTGIDIITGNEYMINASSVLSSSAVTVPLVVGGSGTTQTLTYKTTTGVGATGARHIFQVGNNGATEAMTILNNGDVGVGTSTPSTRLVVVSGAATEDTIRAFNVSGSFPNAGASMGVIANEGVVNAYNNGGTKTILIHSNGNTYLNGGSVGIGTQNPGNALAVNAAGDGVIVDFESADTVEGTVSISGNTTSYNAFVGSHYTQLKDGQTEPPRGAVVVSTGEIIPCSIEKYSEVEVPKNQAINIIPKPQAVEIVEIEVEDRDNILSQELVYTYDPETNTEIETIVYTYGTKTVQKKQLKEGVNFDKKSRKFYTIKDGYRIDINARKAYKTVSNVLNQDGKEYFVYIDTTTTASDKRVYGTWMGKMSDDARGMSFGEDSKAVYLVAQVGLFKIRVTDTNGNISNGDYLETSTRAMEAQRQVVGSKLNSTIAKAMIDVDWANESVDPVLGYKWKLIPCTY